MSVPVKLLWTLGEKKGIEEPRETTAAIDASDTLNWKTTPVLLTICAFIIGGTQAFGEPISCIHPQEIKMWYDYVTSFCFLEGSYSMGTNKTLNDVVRMHPSDRKKLKIENTVDYYQLVPFLLAFQLICFLTPGLFWKWARKRQALDLDTILKHTERIRESIGNAEESEMKMNDLVEYLFEMLRVTPQSCARDHHSLTLLFLSTKMLTLMNVIYQFIFLVHFIGDDGVFFGYEIICSFLAGSPTSRFFPLEVLCDLSFVQMNNNQPYTMQCYLSLNFFHDKMFALLWIWYLFLMVYSLISFLVFSFSLLPLDRHIRSLVSPSLYHSNKQHIRYFYNKMLFTDGMVMLQFISKIKSHNMASEITERLYAKFEQTEAISAWIYPHSLNKKNRSR
ncbi:hypothetical protein PENTCL1PPCAC_30668, partial [Pristionchus entomophagus]